MPDSHQPTHSAQFLKWFGRNALLVAVYYLSGRLGLYLAATGGGYAAPVWPPTGIAIAAIVIWGWRVLPGIWGGAFLVNLFVGPISGATFTGQNLLLSVFIAAGNALEAATAGALLSRFFGFSKLFEKHADVVGY